MSNHILNDISFRYIFLILIHLMHVCLYIYIYIYIYMEKEVLHKFISFAYTPYY